jgi:hypothetical protein
MSHFLPKSVLPKNLFSSDGLMTMEEWQQKRKRQKLRQYYRGLPSSSSSPQVTQRTNNDVKNPSSFVPLNVGKAAKTFGGSMMKAVASSIQL